MRKSLKIIGSSIGSLVLVGAATSFVIYNHKLPHKTINKNITSSHSSFLPSTLATTPTTSNGMVWNLNTNLFSDGYGFFGSSGLLNITPWINGSITYQNENADMSNLQVSYEGQNVSLKMMSASWLVNNLNNTMLESLLEQSIGILDSSFANQSGYLSVSNLKIIQIQDNEFASIPEANSLVQNNIIDNSSTSTINPFWIQGNYNGYTSNINNSVNITFNTTWTNKTLENQFNNSNISQYFNFNNLTINDLAVDASAASNALWNSIQNNTIDINLTQNIRNNSIFLQDFYQFQAWLFNSENFGNNDNYIQYNGMNIFNPNASQPNQNHFPSKSLQTNEIQYLTNLLFQPSNNTSNNPIISPIWLLAQWNNKNNIANDLSISTIATSMCSFMPYYFVFGNGYYESPGNLGSGTLPNGIANFPNKNNWKVYIQNVAAANKIEPVIFNIKNDLQKNNIDNYSNITYNVTCGNVTLVSISSMDTSFSWVPTISQINNLLTNYSGSAVTLSTKEGIQGYPITIQAIVKSSNKTINFVDNFYSVFNGEYGYSGPGGFVSTSTNAFPTITSFLNNQQPISMPQIEVSNLNYESTNTSYTFQIDAKNISLGNDFAWNIFNNNEVTNNLDLSNYYKNLNDSFGFDYNGINMNPNNQKIFENAKSPFNYIALTSPSSSQVTNAVATNINFNTTNETYANRFIELNNLSNSNLFFVCGSNIYNNLDLSNIPYDCLVSNINLTSTNTLPFNSMIIYNLNNYYIPSSINLGEADIDLNNYTYNQLLNVSSTTWKEIVNKVITSYYTANSTNSSYQYYAFPINQNIDIASGNITISKINNIVYINVPFVNKNNNSLIINGLTLQPQTTTTIPIQLIYSGDSSSSDSNNNGNSNNKNDNNTSNSSSNSSNKNDSSSSKDNSSNSTNKNNTSSSKTTSSNDKNSKNSTTNNSPSTNSQSSSSSFNLGWLGLIIPIAIIIISVIIILTYKKLKNSKNKKAKVESKKRK